jgi:hypothetical protein
MLMSLTFKRLQVVDSNNPFISHISQRKYGKKILRALNFFFYLDKGRLAQFDPFLIFLTDDGSQQPRLTTDSE